MKKKRNIFEAAAICAAIGMLLVGCAGDVVQNGKLSRGHQTGKGQLSFQSQRKAMPKNAQTITQLHYHSIALISCMDAQNSLSQDSAIREP